MQANIKKTIDEQEFNSQISQSNKQSQTTESTTDNEEEFKIVKHKRAKKRRIPQSRTTPKGPAPTPNQHLNNSQQEYQQTSYNDEEDEIEAQEESSKLPLAIFKK